MKKSWVKILAFALLGPGSSALAASHYTIALIPRGSTHEFWKSIHAGAVKAQRELKGAGIDIELLWKGPLKEDDRDQQVQVVENFIGRHVDGMILAPLDSRALSAPVETAVHAKIPVVIVDSKLDSDAIVTFIATDNFLGGQLAADALSEAMGGQGKVILLRHQVGSGSTEQREAGFLAALKQRHPKLQIISSDQHSGGTRDTAYRVSQNLLNRFSSEVNGIFTPNESSTAGMILALKDAGKAAGKVKLVGFDASQPLVEALRAGDLQAVVVQDPMQMGYLGLNKIVEHLQGKSVPKKIDTDLKVVTVKNLNSPEVQKLVNPPLDRYLK